MGSPGKSAEKSDAPGSAAPPAPRPPGHDSRPGPLRPAQPPEDVVSQEGCRRRVWDALHRLRVYERELLVLRYLEDLTYDEMASILQRQQADDRTPSAAGGSQVLPRL